jgi:hypothetical protein
LTSIIPLFAFSEALPLVIFLTIVVGGIILTIGLSHQRKRSQQIAAIASSLGFSYHRRSTRAEYHQLVAGWQFATVRSGGVQNMLESAPSEDLHLHVFEYTYAEGRGGLTRQTVARLESPLLLLPSFSLVTEHLSDKLAAAVGFQDIDFDGFPDFNALYRLRGEDESAIRKLFLPAVIQWFEQHQPLSVEGAGDHLLIFRDLGHPLRPEELPPFIEDAKAIFALLFQSNHTAA